MKGKYNVEQSEPALRVINERKHCSFVIKEEPFDLHTRWHYHKDVEIMYFDQGKVAAIMGNRFTEFKQGDLILMGPNFPHVIFEHPEDPSDETPSGIVIQFKYDFLGEGFFEVPELELLKTMINKSANGLKFDSNTAGRLKPLLKDISCRNNIRQVLDLLEILYQMSDSQGYEIISLENHHNFSTSDEERMQLIREYMYQNFKDKVRISEVANLVNMTESSFCRYYKSRTLKSFTNSLNEIRISYACELLRNDVNINEACYKSGFSSPSFFSRVFKKLVGLPPIAYKTQQSGFLSRW